MDLADMDVVEEDNALMVGPHCAADRTGAMQLASLNLKATGAAPAKPETPMCAPSMMPLKPQPPSAGFYNGAIIATANTAFGPHPNGAPLRQARMSAPGGSYTPTSQHASATAAAPARSSDADAGVVTRMQGDILGGDSDSGTPTPTHKDHSLRRHSSAKGSGLAHYMGTGRPKAPPQPPQPPQPDPTGSAAAAQYGTISSSASRRISGIGGGGGRAMPGIEAEPDCRPQLLRGASLNGRQETAPTAAVVVAVQPRSARKAPASAACAAAPHADAAPTPDMGRAAEAHAGRHAVVLQPAATWAAADAALTHSGCRPPDSPSPPIGRPSSSGRSSSDGRPSSVGRLRAIFSRSSSHRKSEGSLLDQAFVPAPGKQQRRSHQGHSQAVIDEEGDVAPSGGIGGGRQASGLLKRTASALLSFVRRGEDGAQQPAVSVA